MNFSQRMTEEPFYEQQAFSVPQWDQDVMTTTFKTQKITKGKFSFVGLTDTKFEPLGQKMNSST